MRNRYQKGGTNAVPILIVAALVILTMGNCGMQHATQKPITVTVNRRELVTDGDNSKYLVWVTKDDGKTETLEDIDAWYFFKFNSSDIYGKLNEGGRYKLTVSGYRFGPTSAYRNIVSVDEVLSGKGNVASKGG